MSSPLFKNHPQAGLTLMEMLTVVAIITILIAVVLANLPAFRHRLALDLLAEEVAVTIRSAQVYGAATRGVPGVPGGAFPSHGIFVDCQGSECQSQPAISFILFADLNRNTSPGYDSSDPTRETFELRGGTVIQKMLGCDPGCDSLTNLHIVFVRPSPDAVFQYVCSGGVGCNPAAASCAVLEIFSPRINESRQVVVWRTGHIYTRKPDANGTFPNSCG